MTTAEVADRLGARPAGDGRWQAKCPAHDDHSPSLSIRGGDGGKVLLHCWAGCDTGAVLTAAGLAWRDICGAPMSPAGRAGLAREHQQRQIAEAAQRQHAEALAATGGALHARAGKIAARLAAIEFGGAAPAYPCETEALAADYHAALRAAREMEMADVA